LATSGNSRGGDLMTASYAWRIAGKDGSHIRIQIFAGPDPNHRALVGELVLRDPEDDPWWFIELLPGSALPSLYPGRPVPFIAAEKARRRAEALSDIEHLLALALKDLPGAAFPAAVEAARQDLAALGVTGEEMDAAGIAVVPS
jgi:hypothetical protein